MKAVSFFNRLIFMIFLCSSMVGYAASNKKDNILSYEIVPKFKRDIPDNLKQDLSWGNLNQIGKYINRPPLKDYIGLGFSFKFD